MLDAGPAAVGLLRAALETGFRAAIETGFRAMLGTVFRAMLEMDLRGAAAIETTVTPLIPVTAAIAGVDERATSLVGPSAAASARGGVKGRIARRTRQRRRGHIREECWCLNTAKT